MTPKEQYYENIANTLIKKFNTRGIEGYYCATREEACSMAKRFLTPGCSVSWGGSMTLNEIGLIDELKTSDCIIYDRHGNPPAPHSLITTADYYFMSSNAITLDGQLVNIDAGGNRVANLIHGPQNIVVIAGMNKLAKDVESAIDRVQNFAAPPNCVRLDRKTPCSTTGHCGNCLGTEGICANIVITRKSMIPNRIKVILVGEELGY